MQSKAFFVCLILTAILLSGCISTQSPESRAHNEVSAKLEEFKTKLETVAIEKTEETVNFALGNYFSGEIVKMVDYSDSEMCASYCGEAKEICTLLEYDYTGENPFTIRICLEIYPGTVFPEEEGACRNKNNYVLTDLRKEIKQGNYLLELPFGLYGTTPIICAYRK